MHNYHSAHDTFPPGYVTAISTDVTNPETGPGWAWGTMLLNALEQAPLYNTVNFNNQITDPSSMTARTAVLSVFLCPSNVGNGPVVVRNSMGSVLTGDLSPGQYTASGGQLEPGEFPGSNNGVFYRNSRNGIRDITDGSSTTLMVGERLAQYRRCDLGRCHSDSTALHEPAMDRSGMRTGKHDGREPYGNGRHRCHLRTQLKNVDGR